MKSLFEELGGTYTLSEDGMYYPNLKIDDTDQRPIGRWGRMQKAYLEEEHPGLYERLLLSGKLYEHLAEIDTCCAERMDRMVSQMAEAEDNTEDLKAKDQLSWVGQMNSIRQQAEEVVLEEIVYT